MFSRWYCCPVIGPLYFIYSTLSLVSPSPMSITNIFFNGPTRFVFTHFTKPLHCLWVV